MQKSLTSRKFKVTFARGVECVISEDQADGIDKAWSRWKDGGSDTKITLPNGSKVLISDWKKCDPYVDEDEQREQHNNEVFGTIRKVMEDSELAKTSTIAQIHIQRMRENFERLKKGEKWQFCDRYGNPCTQEESKISIFGNQNMISHAKSLFGEG